MINKDVLIKLVHSGMQQDKASFIQVVEALIAEEKEKGNTVLAVKAIKYL